jgi:hypothetical protein
MYLLASKPLHAVFIYIGIYVVSIHLGLETPRLLSVEVFRIDFQQSL